MYLFIFLWNWMVMELFFPDTLFNVNVLHIAHFY